MGAPVPGSARTVGLTPDAVSSVASVGLLPARAVSVSGSSRLLDFGLADRRPFGRRALVLESRAMLWPLPAERVYGAYCLLERALRTMYWTAAVYFYISVVGLDPFRLVLVGTALEIVILLGEVPTGVVADVYSRRLSVVIGVALIGVGFALDGWFAAFWATLLAQVVWGLGATFTSGAVTAWIADERGGTDLGRVYLRGSQLESAGSLLGVAVGIALSYAGLALTMIVAGAGLVVLAGGLAAVMPEGGFTPTP